MEGKHLIVSVSSMPPYIHYIINDDVVILQGSFGQLWNILEERLGFTSQFVVESYSLGVLNFRGKRRDVLLRPSVVLSEDIDEFDFTFPITSTWYEIYLKDSDEINSSNSYVKNWPIGLWICTILVMFLFTLLLYLMLLLSNKFLRREIYIVPTYEHIFRVVQYFSYGENKYSLPKNWRKNKIENRKLKNESERSLGNCFIAAVAGFCSQGVYLHTNVVSLRILVLSFLLYGMIMYNAYSALLVSQLTLGEKFLPFDTLEEIPEKGQGYSLCVRPESYPYLYFTVNNTKNELKKRWANIVNHKPCPKDGALTTKEMCAPYVAFLETPAVMNQNFLRSIHCRMTVLNKKYFDVELSILILKRFEYKAKKELNTEIMRFREVGILSYLREKWIRHEETMPGADDQRMQVTFEHIEGVLLVYFSCIAFSFTIFFIEVLVSFLFQRQIRETKWRYNSY